MLKVRAGVTLAHDALASLGALQASVDGEADYAARVDAAKRRWGNVKKSEHPFGAVKDALDAMCWGHRRCAYCEDSAADEIEHIWPKDLYPERVFDWENYLFACGPCNGPKGNAFAVFTPGATSPTTVSRPRNAAVVPPIAGDPVLLDPRRDDPLTYLRLDLVDTFYFTPLPPAGTRARERARYTIATLHLNDRPSVVEARRTAYDGLCAVLDALPARMGRGASITHLRRAIEHTTHRAVWEEMKRQHARIAELTLRFALAPPEALSW